MDYFYCPPEKIEKRTLLIEGEELSHLVHVMRKKAGDEVRVVDGCGTAYDVRLGAITKDRVRCTIHRSYQQHHEPSRSVTICVGILKNPSKFDFLVEKVTELGIMEIVPLRTERTIPSHAKTDRWQKLALAAMKQCGRSYLPKVSELTTLETFINNKRPFDLKMVAHEQADHSIALGSLTSSVTHSIALLVGPEGGFTEEEVKHCIDAGFRPVSLGERRLRTETASIVVAAFSLLLPRL